jgi:hypothetical protein
VTGQTRSVVLRRTVWVTPAACSLDCPGRYPRVTPLRDHRVTRRCSQNPNPQRLDSAAASRWVRGLRQPVTGNLAGAQGSPAERGRRPPWIRRRRPSSTSSVVDSIGFLVEAVIAASATGQELLDGYAVVDQ